MTTAMTPDRWSYLNAYSEELFGGQDPLLSGLKAEATAAGLPDIAVEPVVGRLLMMLTAMTPGRLAIEVGTLAGYSGIWISRGLAREGRLITIEAKQLHADFARKSFRRAGVGDRVEIEVGPALEVLAALAGELAPGSVDVLFLDAVKSEYSDYFRTARPLIAPGGLVLADNVFATGSGWIDQGHGTDAFNRLIAVDPDFDAVAVPLVDGVMIARRNT